MKFIAILLIAVIAISAVQCSKKHNRQSSMQYSDEDYSSERQGRTSSLWRSNNRDEDSDEMDSQENTGLAAYRNKIKKRLNRSEELDGKTQIKNKIMEEAENKLEECKTKIAGKNKISRSCAGRVTGQAMQMIAVHENVLRRNRH